MTDKDMTERSVFALQFPSAHLQLFLFHTLRSFSQEVTIDKMGIRSGQRDALLALFNEMATSRSEEQFEEQVSLLEEMNIPAVSRYFRRSWLPIKCEWVRCFKMRHFTLGEERSNRLESFNGKIKSVCTRYSSLDCFFSDLFSVLRVLRGERDHAKIIARISRSTKSLAYMRDADRQYMSHLTAYAYQLVVCQLERRDSVKLPPDDDRPIMSSEGPLFVTSTSCQCAFRATHRLPCRHMFARRQKEGLPSYDVTLVDKRWTASYCGIVPDGPTSSTLSLRRSQTPTPAANEPSEVSASDGNRFGSCGLASEVGHVEFLERLDVLKQLRTEWANAIVPVVSRTAAEITRRTYNVLGGGSKTVRLLTNLFTYSCKFFPYSRRECLPSTACVHRCCITTVSGSDETASRGGETRASKRKRVGSLRSP